MAGPAREIHQPGQRPVDAGRGDLDLIIAFDRVILLEEVEQGVGKNGATLDIHAAIGPLGHHLQGLGSAAHDAQTHQLEARFLDHGLKHRFQMRCRLNRQTKAFRPRRSCDRHTTALVVWDGGYVRRKRPDYKA